MILRDFVRSSLLFHFSGCFPSIGDQTKKSIKTNGIEAPCSPDKSGRGMRSLLQFKEAVKLDTYKRFVLSFWYFWLQEVS